jgi:phosphoribosyl-AMP cyclohydrolase
MNSKDLRMLSEAYSSMYQENKEHIQHHSHNEDSKHDSDYEHEIEKAVANYDAEQSEGSSSENFDDDDNESFIESVVSEAKKAVSAKTNINPWAIEKALEKKTGHHYSKEKKEKIVKGIKKGAKKLGKKITSKAIKKK